MKLIVGLGNPGKEYAITRHNVGFLVLDALAGNDSWKTDKKLKAELKKVGDTIYIKPNTFMNNSGEAVRAVLDYYQLTVSDLLVIYDDKDLPLGTIRFRAKGSSGGHNGIKSIIQHVGSEEFARFKIGIAPTDPERRMGDTADYVLGKFSKPEQTELKTIIEQTVEKIQTWMQS